ncbi:MAG: site-specific DNA-methyltransferase, partial [Armatimonadetes bacterium]|nr:site-specific DNA-methyltransferase [Armatimonadota bacterium]
MSYAQVRRRGANGDINKLLPEDLAVHGWYRFVLSFPPHLVRDYLLQFALRSDQTVLDPFCGTGTTLVECKQHGIPSIGVEANPVAHFASSVKTDWDPDPEGLLHHARFVADIAGEILEAEEIPDEPLFQLLNPKSKELRTLPAEKMKLL